MSKAALKVCEYIRYMYEVFMGWWTKSLALPPLDDALDCGVGGEMAQARNHTPPAQLVAPGPTYCSALTCPSCKSTAPPYRRFTKRPCLRLACLGVSQLRPANETVDSFLLAAFFTLCVIYFEHSRKQKQACRRPTAEARTITESVKVPSVSVSGTFCSLTSVYLCSRHFPISVSCRGF